MCVCVCVSTQEENVFKGLRETKRVQSFLRSLGRSIRMLHVSQTIGDDHFRVRQVLFHISFCYYYHTASSLSNPCSFPVRPQLGRRSQGSSVVHEECNNHENGEITPSPPERRRKINTSFRQGILCEQQIQASRAFAADRGIQNKPTKKIIDEGIRCLCGAIFKGHY